MNDSKRNYSTLRYLMRLRDNIKPALAFNASTIDEWKQWNTSLRKKLLDIFSIGGLRCPLNVETVETIDQGDYIREKIVLDVDEDISMPSYVLVPKNGTRPYKTVLCLHGHGYGKDDVVGITRGDPDRINWGYRTKYDYAVHFAIRGYLVMAPDARGFGERAEEGGCQKPMLYANLMGKDLTGMRIWDEMRALDYLETRKDVDTDRIGCAGLSMGGWHTTLLAALDERIKVALIGGFFNTFRRAFLDSHLHCSCHFPARLYAYADIPDLAGLIAPRPLIITSGTNDYFPIDGAKEACAKLRKIYDVLEASDKLDHDIFEGGHEFSGRKAFKWFEQWL